MNHTKKALSFLISIPLLISTLTFSVSAESTFEDFNFEWTDMSTIDDKYITQMIEIEEEDDPNYYFNVTKDDFCGQLNGHAFDYNYLTTSLSNYKSGSIKKYLIKNDKHTLFCRKGCFYYDYNIEENSENHYLYGTGSYEKDDTDFYSMLGYFLDGATPFNLKGDVYFVHDQFYFNVDMAIVEVNNTPKYVVLMDGIPGLASDKKIKPEEKAMFDTYYYITGISNTQYELECSQYVFDFDFIVNLCKSDAGTLPNDYKYVPKGLEKGMLEKYRSCVSKSEYDGIVYYYNKLGECKGAYTGWAEGAYGKKYYRDGVALTGAQRIDRKKYHFDNNGVLIEEKSK